MKEKNRIIVRGTKFQFPNLEKKCGELVMFFNDISYNYGSVFSWMEVGQHSEASIEFYWSTKKVDKKTAEEFLELYCNTYGCKKEEFELREKMDYSLIKHHI